MFLHSGARMCLRAGGWQSHSLCMADCSASAKDTRWRLERVICLLGLNSSPPVSRRPLLPLLSLHAVLFWRWRAFLSVFACIRFSWCSWLCFMNLHSWCYTQGHVCTDLNCRCYKVSTSSFTFFHGAISDNGAEVLVDIKLQFLYIYLYF